MPSPTKKAHSIFTGHKGTLRTCEALRAGIHPRVLYGMRDRGEIEQIARGLFRLAELPPPGDPDLFTVAKKVPQSVFCLLTALAFHQMTTQIPHAVDLALPHTARIPRLAHPPIQVFRFSPESLNAGIETHIRDGVVIRIYCREKLWLTFSSIGTKSALMSRLKLFAYTGPSQKKIFKL